MKKEVRDCKDLEIDEIEVNLPENKSKENTYLENENQKIGSRNKNKIIAIILSAVVIIVVSSIVVIVLR